MFFGASTTASMQCMHLIRAWRPGGVRLLLCLTVQWPQHRHGVFPGLQRTGISCQRHPYGGCTVLRRVFAFARLSSGAEASPEVFGANEVGRRYRRVGQCWRNGGRLQSARPRDSFYEHFASTDLFPESQTPPAAPFTWALMFCWAGRPQGRELTRMGETADRWPPVRAADTVIQPVGYNRA
jgi:hypothetical protein